MVFGADWDEPLTPEEMAGREFTVDELRMTSLVAPIVIATRTNIETVGDEAVCAPCRERDGEPLAPGEPIEHPRCESETGCRCVGVVAVA